MIAINPIKFVFAYVYCDKVVKLFWFLYLGVVGGEGFAPHRSVYYYILHLALPRQIPKYVTFFEYDSMVYLSTRINLLKYVSGNNVKFNLIEI